MRRRVVFAAAVTLTLASPARAEPPADRKTEHEVIAIPDGAGGIGFDDLRYDARSKRLLIPAGRTGRVELVDPVTREHVSIEGFTRSEKREGDHGQGVTSVDTGEGWLFAVDRGSREVVVADMGTRKIVTRAKLEGGPDYVRFVAPLREVWVTEPRKEQIEVFALGGGGKNPPVLQRKAPIAVKGGPESLAIDAKRKRAHTHLWKKSTVVIDLEKHAIAATWPAGCEELRGIALDEEHGWLFVGCEEGAATVLDTAHDGRVLSTAKAAKGIDIIAYDPARRHLYAPGEESAELSILSVSMKGELSTVATLPAVSGAHCATTDERGFVYVCDPTHGQLLVLRDPEDAPAKK